MNRRFSSIISRVLAYLWAAPNTLLGLGCGILGLLCGGKVQLRQGCIEFYGGGLAYVLRRLPPNGVRAITIGHAILGLNERELDQCRKHEQVHVRQYERWGVAFIPAYLSCSFYLWLLEKDFYRANPFEVEAFSCERE